MDSFSDCIDLLVVVGRSLKNKLITVFLVSESKEYHGGDEKTTDRITVAPLTTSDRNDILACYNYY